MEGFSRVSLSTHFSASPRLKVKELEEEALALRKKGHHQNAMIIYKEAYRLRVATLG